MNAHTVLRALDLDAIALPPGTTVLVTGGAGAVGGHAIQLALIAGLIVIADAATADETLIRDLGAHIVVPRGADMPAVVRTRFPHGVDAAIDATRIGSAVADLVRDGGIVVGGRSTDVSGDDRIRRSYVSVLQRLTDTAALERLTHLLANGGLRVRVATQLPFGEAAEAHRLVEQGGLRGRVVLRFDPTDGMAPINREVPIPLRRAPVR